MVLGRVESFDIPINPTTHLHPLLLASDQAWFEVPTPMRLCASWLIYKGWHGDQTCPASLAVLCESHLSSVVAANGGLGSERG